MPLTLIMIEWFTNSCKYGAPQRCPGGRLDIKWETVGGKSNPPSAQSAPVMDRAAAARQSTRRSFRRWERNWCRDLCGVGWAARWSYDIRRKVPII